MNCESPRWLQRFLICALHPIIWIAKLLITGKNPKDKERGMDFFYDVVDWVGGYSYESMSTPTWENSSPSAGLLPLLC